jgi:predicted nucleotidyltransferase
LEKSERTKKKFRKMLNKDQIASIVDFAEAYPVISAIYLFGSHATGHERSRSDIDLGVLFNEDVDGFKRIDMETDSNSSISRGFSPPPQPSPVKGEGVF